MGKFLSGILVGMFITIVIFACTATGPMFDWPHRWMNEQGGTKTYEFLIGWKDRGMPNCSSLTSSGDGTLVLMNDKESAEGLRLAIAGIIEEFRKVGFEKYKNDK